MGSWWQSQLNFAEGLLDQVDKKVTSAVGANEDQPGGNSSSDREGTCVLACAREPGSMC